jgi:predicted RNase H-like HicB family nuclease
MKNYKIVIEKYSDGYVGYPLGLRGVIVGQGDSYDEALQDTKSAVKFHIDTFGDDVLKVDQPVLQAYIADANLDT